MTRINCIPPEELTDKHLLAEYRELPRIFKLARQPKNQKEADSWPKKYTLGTGHVCFFYDKLEYLFKRQINLVEEMQKRGFNTSFDPYALPELFKDKFSNTQFFNDWKPTYEAMSINRDRISIRLRESNERRNKI